MYALLCWRKIKYLSNYLFADRRINSSADAKVNWFRCCPPRAVAIRGENQSNAKALQEDLDNLQKWEKDWQMNLTLTSVKSIASPTCGQWLTQNILFVARYYGAQTRQSTSESPSSAPYLGIITSTSSRRKLITQQHSSDGISHVANLMLKLPVTRHLCVPSIWLFHWYFPQFSKSDMSKYGYLEVFQRVPSTSR